jgi:hypothetical protein
MKELPRKGQYFKPATLQQTEDIIALIVILMMIMMFLF